MLRLVLHSQSEATQLHEIDQYKTCNCKHARGRVLLQSMDALPIRTCRLQVSFASDR